jgi:MscS family membrane protein
LDGNKDIKEGWSRVRFKNIADYSFEIDISAYVLTNKYWKYLQVVEGLNLQIMDIVEKSGTAFAYPTRTFNIEKDELLSTRSLNRHSS